MKTASEPITVAERRFAAAVREFREAKGLSQGQLAYRMVEAGWPRYHQGTVSRTETNERPIRLGEAVALAQIFGVSLDVMTGEHAAATKALSQAAALEREAQAAHRTLEAVNAVLSQWSSNRDPLSSTDGTTITSVAPGDSAWMEAAE